MSQTLIVASHNEGKVREIRALLAPLGFTVASAAERNLPEPEETGETFEANAALKARAAALATGTLSLADDSGLAVPGLGGAPGIYSARWAGERKDFSLAMQRVADELRARGIEPEGAPAYFVCVLALAEGNGDVTCVRGEVHGRLTFPARGARGFGYDPIFIADGYDATFGEIDPEEKHRISHRAHAFAALLDHLRSKQAA